MGSHDDDSASAFAGAEERKVGRSIFLRRAARETGFIAASLLVGFAVGVAYRFLFDPTGERTLPNFLRSGLQGAGVALTVWTVHDNVRVGRPLPSRLGAQAVADRRRSRRPGAGR